MGKTFAHQGYVGEAVKAPFLPNIAHVYQHDGHHAPATIVANKEGLLAIRAAIDQALAAEGDIKTSAEVVPNDGEGYHLLIYRVDKSFEDRVWDDLPSTYEIPGRALGDHAYDVEMALRQEWPCPMCHGFKKIGNRLDPKPGQHWLLADFDEHAVDCEHCKRTGVVHERPDVT